MTKLIPVGMLFPSLTITITITILGCRATLEEQVVIWGLAHLDEFLKAHYSSPSLKTCSTDQWALTQTHH